MSWIAGSLAALAALFVLAELFARAWIHRRREYFVWRPWERTRMRLDRAALPMLREETRFDVNGDGERGERLPAELKAEHQKVLSALG